MIRSKKWSMEEQAYFLRLISELLDRGYSLSDSFSSIKYQLHKKRHSDLQFCIDSLKEGHSFSNILQMLDFNDDLIGYVYYAERHGEFSTALGEGSDIILNRRKDLERMFKLLYYPFILVIFTLLMFIIVEKVLLPQFVSLFSSLNIEENFFTKLLLIVAKLAPFLTSLILFSIISILAYYFLKFRKKQELRKKEILVKIPLLGRLLRLFYTHYFSIQLSYLLAGGLSLTESLQVFANNDNQRFYKEMSIVVQESLLEGERLEKIMMQFSFFEGDLGNVLFHGQKNGRLDKELYFYSRHCLNSLERLIEKTIKIIQPILYSSIGVLIVSMYLAILLPMFKLLNSF